MILFRAYITAESPTMLLSVQYDYCFLCVPKTGSTSVENMLWRHTNMTLGTGSPRLKHVFYQHYEDHILPLVQALHPGKQLETVAVVRDPYQWVASWYKFRGREELADPAHMLHRTYTGQMAFEEFVSKLAEGGNNPPHGIRDQCRHITDASGAVAVDRLFRMDDMDQLVAYFRARTGAELELPVVNQSRSRQVVYSAESRRIVESLFSRDFDIYHSLG